MVFQGLTAEIESWGRKNEMSRAEFDRLVTRAKEENAVDPAGYKKRVVFFGLLGYLFVFAVVGIVLWATISFAIYYITSAYHSAGGGKLLLLLGLTLLILLGSLWVRYEAPEGIRVQRAQCPELYNLIDELCRSLKVRIDEVVLSSDIGINAAVQQIPRLGILGFPKNYLILGYPLMASESPEMFRATLAHEFGHVSGSHGKTGAWIYAVYTTFSQLLGNLREGSPLLYCAFFGFFHWYNPRFAAYSLVLRRRHEIEADQMAIDFAGAEANALGLINDEIKNRLLASKFWPELYKTANTTAVAPPDVVEREAGFLRTAIQDEEEAQNFLKDALMRKTDNNDSHPCLLERLVYAKFPAASEQEISSCKLDLKSLLTPATTAANMYLAGAEESLCKTMSQTWVACNELVWEARNKQVEEYRKEITRLESLPELSKDDLAAKAYLYVQVEGTDGALPVIHELLTSYPEHGWGNLTLGTHLLEKRDESGVQYVEKSMQSDTMITPSGCEALVDYYKSVGKHEHAETYLQRMDRFQRDINFAIDERRALNDNDQFEPHDKDAEDIAHLQAQIEQYKEIKTAYLVRKYVRHLPELPCYVLGLQMTANMSLNSERDIDVLARLSHDLDFAGDIHVFIVNKKAMEKMSFCGEAVVQKK